MENDLGTSSLVWKCAWCPGIVEPPFEPGDDTIWFCANCSEEHQLAAPAEIDAELGGGD
jgi:hypothetical protein